jgi:hypothetical protein
MRTVRSHLPDSPLASVVAVILVVAALAGSPVEAATYHVDDDSCPGPGGGTPADPFCSIQAGIDAASAGDTVEVAAGTYLENITLKSGVVVQGAGQGDTIIDGGGSGSVVTAIGVDSAATLDGFTITNGNAYNGGGMYNSGSSPTVSNCTFSANTAFLVIHIGEGGGMYNSGSSPTVTNCTFSGNDASGKGGGMYNLNSSTTVTNCTFSGNTADRGGGMYNEISSPTVSGCTFSGNADSASGVGGGGMANDDSSPTVSTCSFFDNSTGVRGGGMANFNGSSPTVANCIFSENDAGDSYAKDMANLGASPRVSSCTFWNNGGMIYNDGTSSTTVTNCVFWGFFDSIINQGGASTTVTYSVVIYPGTGNINVDPMLVDPANGDFHLRPFSPCIDAGDNSDPALPATDIDGDDRRIDDPTVPDTGAGEPPIVDIGADEFDPWASIFGDGFESGNLTAWSATLGDGP